ncbi:hypothetical protein HPB51_023472 [Rhipicephalus microplus]|uniref:Uncharacterized protein n=1 Tax=Rhipicephalus microplus TaxID=6941 RepID=A0A9J6F7V0_RHIMP|nr:hypothetical protein HPB51_023472 [Rhipicephalus microplus]
MANASTVKTYWPVIKSTPFGRIAFCEDLKDTKIWDLDQLHEKSSTFEDTTCTNAAYRITGFGRRRRDSKPGAVRRRVRRLAHHYATDFLRHFLTELEVNARDSQVKRNFQRRKRRGPTPLPKEDIKVILRPHKGLKVKNLFGSELSMAVIEACRNSFGGESFLLRVHPGSNIIILSTPHEQVAGRLREINQLKIRGRIHPFNAYVADPEDVLRGIVHGLPPGTTQADLMANLRIRTQGVKIERARMLGSSKSAILTFTGDVLPRCLYFMGAEAICYPYKPTVQVCKICRSTGHRTDVCPTLNANVCSKCGTCDPTQEHECALNCAICGEEHATGDKSCKKKLKNVAPRKS